jgi:hypothetical protein
MKKTIILFAAIAGLMFAASKKYEVVFDAPAVLGPMEVESGHYMLSYDGAKVTLVNESSRKSFETTATVQTSPTKYSETSIESTKDGARMKVNQIHLAGTTTMLDFTH